ncbi:exosortase family protein XrtF [Aurantibacter sp.]|uniref:exosortase family protein XrtF n=1 Tax=Aurantibacter sp. TaxID=2807103 RepID=UPI0035C87374
MTSLLKAYKPVLQFIATFLGVYFVLIISYKFYLDLSEGSHFFPDYFSNLVGRQTVSLLNSLGYTAAILPDGFHPVLNLSLQGRDIAFIAEGCNGISIIILFVSFIVAFADKLKTTFLYILVGSVLIYVANLIRIVIIAIAIYKYPAHQETLHGVVFPGLIYSMVFVLWMFWVRRFNKSKIDV